MSKRIIISGSERILNPYISFIMSLFITGTGEIYSGSPQRGVILALIRAAAALAVPFYSITNIKSSYLTEIFISLLFFLLVTIYSPVNALLLSLRTKKIILSRYSSSRFIIIFSLCSLILVFLSSAVFFTFFSIIRLNEAFPPAIEKGDYAVIKKTGNRLYERGDSVVLKNGSLSIVRIIGQPGDSVSYSKGRFSVQGSELFLSIFSETELNQFSLADYEVISETGGSFKYPVIQNSKQFKADVNLKADEYFAAPDNRNNTAGFATIKSGDILGRMDGLIFSAKRVKLLISPFKALQ